MPGRTVVQWDKDDCEDLGIIKVDFLGLGMMAVLQETFAMTRERGHPIELYTIPHDDDATFDLLQRADTVGTFQVESRAQMATLPRMKPVTFYEVAIQVAIIRPGPIAGDLTHPYLRRRQGKEEVSYLLPELEPVLKRTLGVPLFQEQMLQIAMIVAGFDGNQADELRRAISFHRSHERMEKVVVKLRENMERKGIAPEIRDKIVQSLASFALYGFPESHAISFALLAYASCWLKVHRAPEFYCALLNNQPMGFYSPASLVKDGKRHGVQFRPVCVVRSQEKCLLEHDGSVRLGLNYVRGLHRDNAARLVAQRDAAPFTSLRDLLHRVPLNKAERRALARLGALNLLSHHRRQALWEVEGLFDDGLFDDENLVAAPESAMEENPLLPMTPLERLASDYAVTGLTTGPHPMTFLRAQIAHVSCARDLRQRKHGEKVTIAGVVICRQRPGTAKGNVFISLEDETGISNAFVPSPLFEKHRLTITHEPFLEISGQVQNVDGVISILAHAFRGLDVPTTLSTQSYDFH
jgi:error-prone DNA polymerase